MMHYPKSTYIGVSRQLPCGCDKIRALLSGGMSPNIAHCRRLYASSRHSCLCFVSAICHPMPSVQMLCMKRNSGRRVGGSWALIKVADQCSGCPAIQQIAQSDCPCCFFSCASAWLVAGTLKLSIVCARRGYWGLR